MKIAHHFTLIGLVCIGAATSAVAEPRDAPDTESLTLVGVDTRPTTIRSARKTLKRIEEAALAVCGAPQGSSRPLRQAVRKSDCWKDSVERAVEQIGNPLLASVHSNQS